MDIRVLRYFLAVAREENITRAAERLHIAQPSLSRQLIALEEELGKPLFLRGKRKITLTEDGIFLRKRAEEIISLFEKTEEEIRSDQSALSGKIAIGGMPNKKILQAAARLRAKHPDIRFAFYSSDATEVMERLDHGNLDFAVLLQPIDPVKYEYLSLEGIDQWGLLLPSDCPLAEKEVIEREDLRRVPLIMHARIGLQREIAHWAQAETEELHIAATYNIVNGDPAVFVRSGLGYFLTSKAHLAEPLDFGLRFRPLSPPLELRLALVWKRYAIHSKAAQAFLAEYEK